MTENPKALKKKYGEVIEVVTASIGKLDPYALLANGAPLDEFGPEIARIATRAIDDSTTPEFAAFISNVLNDSLEGNYTTQDCLAVAEEIRAELKRRGLMGPDGGD